MCIQDWFVFWATIGAGVLSALATWFAVVYTNNKTAKSYEKEIERQRQEKIDQYKRETLVIIKPVLMMNTFFGILDMLIMQNSWDRVLLFSGEDGFDFFDDIDKRTKIQCTILFVENNAITDLNSMRIETSSKLKTDTDEIIEYHTKNFTKLLRSKEKIAIRLQNTTQHEKIIEMQLRSASNVLEFVCKMEYETIGKQRVCYTYSIHIKDNRKIEVIKDEYTVSDEVVETSDASIFRDLQNSISSVDRNSYAWRKMGESQALGIGSMLESIKLLNNPSKSRNTDDVINAEIEKKDAAHET